MGFTCLSALPWWQGKLHLLNTIFHNKLTFHRGYSYADIDKTSIESHFVGCPFPNERHVCLCACICKDKSLHYGSPNLGPKREA